MNIVTRTRFLRPAVLFILTAVTTVVPASATLLVYEGFNGYTAAGTRLDAYKPNANTVGLDTNVTYYDGGGSRTANYTLDAASLSLGSLQTSGGSLKFTSGTNVIGADLNLSSAFTGTLWNSYLVRLTTQGTSNGNGAVLRVGATPADSTNGYFNSFADSRADANTAHVSIAYGPAGTSQPNNGTAALATNTTYIIISRFTNVGSTLSTGTPGEATLWALTESQFTAFINSGGNEAALAGTTVTATATQTIASGNYAFSSSQAFGLVTVGDAGTYDELRFGSTLADVTPTAIPEPAATAVILGIGCGFLILGCRTSRRR
jgi:hypothetical protein